MPKILKPIKADPEWAKLGVPEALFPEPDHEPEREATARYEALRDGVKLRGVSEPEEPLSASETATPAVSEALFPEPRRTPATPEEADRHHDCDQPSHQPWFILWCADHGFPPPRDYLTCKGYRRLQARSVEDLKAAAGDGH